MNTISELIEHYRAKARHFNEIADTIEADAGEYGDRLPSNGSRRMDLGELPPAPIRRNHRKRVFKVKTPPPTEATGHQPTLDEVKGYLNTHQARPIEVARYFGCDKQDVVALVGSENGIEHGHAGWLKLIDPIG